MKKLNWNIGDAIYNYQSIFDFCRIMKLSGENIGLNVYDNIPNSIWNAGRVQPDIFPTDEQFLEIVKSFNDLGVGFNVVATNRLIESDLWNLRRENNILKEIYNPLNGIIIGDDDFACYLKNKYPDFRFIKSTTSKNQTRTEADLDYYWKASEFYDLVVLDEKLNRNINFIKKLPVDKIEIMANEPCYRNCPYRDAHYDVVSLANMVRTDENMNKCLLFCRNMYANKMNDLFHVKYAALTQQELNNAIDAGINNIKLVRMYDTHPKVMATLQKYVVDFTGITTKLEQLFIYINNGILK